MEPDKINRFCRLVTKINELNDYLQKESANFYDGGHSFEEVYSSDLEELKAAQEELEIIIKTIAR